MIYQILHRFTSKNQKYEIKLIDDGESIRIKAYKENGQPANEIEYRLEYETETDENKEEGKLSKIDLLTIAAEFDVRNRIV